jgi:hypothetical protein
LFAVYAVMLCLLSLPGYPDPQSRADYDIQAVLSPDSSTISASADIVFTSGVDFPVDTLWIHLYPNAYRDYTTAFGQDLEKSAMYDFRRSEEPDRGWIELSDWTVNGEITEAHVNGSLGYFILSTPLEAGASVQLNGNFLVRVPIFWSRMGRYRETFQITQWYPKMCVLDQSGWHKSQYHAEGEFFSDFGDYSVAIDVPSDFITAATGMITETAFSADSSRRIDHWTATDVHDFAWSSSPCYTIRDHVFTYPDGGTVRVHLVLLDEDENYWEGIAEVVDSTLACYGEWYTPYPYKDLWVVDPVVPGSGGMEYPQFILGYFDEPMFRSLEMVIAHETGHQWFYGILANDEVDEAWLDEGMNSFSELRFMERRYGFSGNMTTAPRWLLNLSDRDMNALDYVSNVYRDITPVLSRSTNAGDGSYSTSYTYYTKPALFMSLLQAQLGDSLFNDVMATYFERFSFNHPHTEDFQAIVEELSGESWAAVFNFWLRGTDSSDIRVFDFAGGEDSSSVTIGGDIPHPVRVPLLFESDSDTLNLSVAVNPGEETEITVAGEWTRAVADPFMRLPDRAPWNNSAPVHFRFRPFGVPVAGPDQHNVWILPFPWYADNSWRADGLFLVTPLPAETGGPYTLSSHISIPFKEKSAAAWGLSLTVPVQRDYSDEILLTTGLFSGYGVSRLNSRFVWNAGGVPAAEPEITGTLGVDLISVSDTSVYGGENIEKGSFTEFSASWSLFRQNFQYSLNAGAEIFTDPGWAGEACAGIDCQAEISFSALPGNSTRLYAGGVTGDTPVHRTIRPAGGLFAGNTVQGSLVPPDGPLSAQQHYFIRTGPALPGYWNSSLRGKVGFSLEQRLSFPVVPLGVFAGTGWVGNSFEDLKNGPLISNAGILVEASIFEAVFPLWVSDPVHGENNWEFRWRVGISY